jgi:8-oxo-dGTP pyrophosphatase MutT (NUDIX family)
VTFADAVARLEAALARELPGAAAQDRMAPVPRRQWPTSFNPARIRNAAGLLLVFPAVSATAEPAPHTASAESGDRDDRRRAQRVSRVLGSSSKRAHIVLTVRADTLRRHSGQVSLPGGVLEPGETFEQAALREAHEEIALATDTVRILGALTPLDIPVSGFRLHPIVGVTDLAPTLTPVDGEVARILEVDIESLLDPAGVVHSSRERDGIPLTVPAFFVSGHEIWGATAMVLAEFLTLLGWEPRTVG